MLDFAIRIHVNKECHPGPSTRIKGAAGPRSLFLCVLILKNLKPVHQPVSAAFGGEILQSSEIVLSASVTCM
jgi:hypothetical protein